MAVSGVGSTTTDLIYKFTENDTKKETDTSENSYKNQLDKDAFLKLLTTQLRYQDPLSPMEDKEFITQMASFNSLEQMQEVNKNLTGMDTSLQDILTQMNSTLSTGLTAVNANLVDGLETIAKDVRELLAKVESSESVE